MRLLLALLVCVPVAAGQLSSFGDVVPLTHTRYGAFGGTAKLVGTGPEAFLFWSADGKVRTTKIAPGLNRVGRPVVDGSDDFDAIWTGRHFVVAATRVVRGESLLITRVLDGNGEPLSEPQWIPGAGLSRPHLASNGSTTLLLYRTTAETRAAVLADDGTVFSEWSDPVLKGEAVTPVSFAANGSAFLAMLAQPSRITFASLSPAGQTLRTESVAASSGVGAIVPKKNAFVAVWKESQSGSLVIADLNPDASVRNPRIVPQTEAAESPSLLEVGERLYLAYVKSGLVHVQDSHGVPYTTPVASLARETTLAARGELPLLSWHGLDQLMLRRVAHTNASPAAVAYGAMSQTVLATASSRHAALVVWSERNDVHAGVRSIDGSWRENRIGRDETVLAAASDGQEYAVLKSSAVAFLDATGRLIAQTNNLPFLPSDIAWNGTNYIVVGTNAQNAVVMASVSKDDPGFPVWIVDANGGDTPRIASNSDSSLIVWRGPYTLGGLLLDRWLQPTTTVMKIAGEVSSVDVAAEDDGRYVVVWNAGGSLEMRSVRAKSLTSPVPIAGIQPGSNTLRAEQVSGGVVVTFSGHQIVLIRGGAEAERHTFEGTITPDAAVGLGRYGILYVQAMVRDEMPYHGAQRVFTRLADGIRPAPAPAAPRIAAQHTNLIHVSWTAPAPIVSGYRVEYSVDGGVWNELDEWFDKDETSFSIRPWVSGDYRFRVRALNHWGVGAYSNEASVRSTKRRAIN